MSGMLLRRGVSVLAILGSLVIASLASVSSVAAAPQMGISNHSPFIVSGSIVPTASPQAYQAAHPDAHFFSDTQTLPYLSNITYYIASGAFQVSSRSGTQVAGVELAISQTTKTQLLAIGVATPTLIARHTLSSTDRQSATNSTAPQTPSSTRGSSSAREPAFTAHPDMPLSWMKIHFMDTTWWDFAGIDLNGVRTEIRYNYVYGQYITNWQAADYRNWAPDGWIEVYFWLHSYLTNSGIAVLAETNDAFDNPIFCGTFDTWTYYDTNEVQGDDYGGFSSSINTWDAGPCTFLLHYTFYDG